MYSNENTLNEIKNKLNYFIVKNGPDKNEYEELNSVFNEIGHLKKIGVLTESHILQLQKLFGEAMNTCKTLQGQVCIKPYGYAGDYEIIDKIYTNFLNLNPDFIKWDHFFQQQPATIAVRNRKEFIKRILNSKQQNIKILSLVSGSCRDLIEYFVENTRSEIRIDTLEFDPNAIAYSKGISKVFNIDKLIRINYIQENIFKFSLTSSYDLIWSSGLFDYLNDQAFEMVLKKLYPYVNDNGEIIIGNFSVSNSSKDYMEFGQWYLHHRTEEDLISLAERIGVKNEKISISKEAQGVNLFLHIKK